MDLCLVQLLQQRRSATALAPHLPPDRSLAMFPMPTSTTHLLNHSTTLAVVILAILLVDRLIALIIETTVLTNVVEGKNMPREKMLTRN